MDFPILSLLTFLPLVGVAFILMIRGDSETVARNSRRTAMFVSSFTFILSFYMLLLFDPKEAGFQFVEKIEWFDALNISYHMGIDGIC